jgi:hypothetical protein
MAATVSKVINSKEIIVMNIQFFPEHETITMSKNRFLSICLKLSKERIYGDRLFFDRLLKGFKHYLEIQEEGTEAKPVQAEGRAIDVLFEGPDEQTASVQGAKNKLGWMIEDLYDEWEKAFQQEFEQSPKAV